MKVRFERRGPMLGYIERAEYEFRAGLDDTGRPVVALFATTDDELDRLKSARLVEAGRCASRRCCRTER